MLPRVSYCRFKERFSSGRVDCVGVVAVDPSLQRGVLMGWAHLRWQGRVGKRRRRFRARNMPRLMGSNLPKHEVLHAVLTPAPWGTSELNLGQRSIMNRLPQALSWLVLRGLVLAGMLPQTGCIRVSTDPIRVEPITIEVTINHRIQRELEDVFGENSRGLLEARISPLPTWGIIVVVDQRLLKPEQNRTRLNATLLPRLCL